VTDARQVQNRGGHPMLVQIALNIPSEETFTYRVPTELKSQAAVGVRALVPLGRTKKTGVIVGINGDSPPFPTKDIIDLLDSAPLFGPEELSFYRWVSEYYLYPLGKLLMEILPGREKKSLRCARIASSANVDIPSYLTPLEVAVIEFLKANPQGMTIKSLQEKTKISRLDHILQSLSKKGIIEIFEKIRGDGVREKMETFYSLTDQNMEGKIWTPAQERVILTLKEYGTLPLSQLCNLSHSHRRVIERLAKKGYLTKAKRPVARNLSLTNIMENFPLDLVANENQQKAIEKITEALGKKKFSPFLLHGVTGSGKTEVYIKVMGTVLEQGGSVLYLVPEIALTPQLIGRLQTRFPREEIAVLHSGISDPLRYDQWRLLNQGKIKIACGARSSVFAPLRNLRLIVIDEEHDESYKQEERLPYNARDIALMRGMMREATVILGSATPSVQSYHLSQEGRYTLLNLPHRVEQRPLPSFEIVDLRLVREGEEIISPPLREAIGETLRQGKQTLLFLNRRGFYTSYLCKSCGYNHKCPNCDVSLTLHTNPKSLLCHYCDYTEDCSLACPRCGGRKMIGYGVGTQRVEELITQYFPHARISRLDRDIAGKPSARAPLLKAILHGETDIIVGTQMISKGHDFPGIALVGVICADLSLHMPDFRASERSFQLFMQVAGRGGRGETPGRVIIQTFNPENYVLKHVQAHDYDAFYREEIAQRKLLRYPPFSRLMCLEVSGINGERCSKEAKKLGQSLREAHLKNVEILGPAPAPLSRLRGRFRWQIIVKGTTISTLHLVARLARDYPLPSGIQLKWDIDPLNFM